MQLQVDVLYVIERGLKRWNVPVPLKSVTSHIKSKQLEFYLWMMWWVKYREVKQKTVVKGFLFHVQLQHFTILPYRKHSRLYGSYVICIYSAFIFMVDVYMCVSGWEFCNMIQIFLHGHGYNNRFAVI